ncbi:MAG: hypothetical protein J6R68_00505, partial [Clostridia bacterium]|nr:hypothetical protein [Clostridia bacterium]
KIFPPHQSKPVVLTASPQGEAVSSLHNLKFFGGMDKSIPYIFIFWFLLNFATSCKTKLFRSAS